MTSDYMRDKKTGALILVNQEKASAILKQRSIEDEIKMLKQDINTLRNVVNKLIAERN